MPSDSTCVGTVRVLGRRPWVDKPIGFLGSSALGDRQVPWLASRDFACCGYQREMTGISTGSYGIDDKEERQALHDLEVPKGTGTGTIIFKTPESLRLA